MPLLALVRPSHFPRILAAVSLALSLFAPCAHATNSADSVSLPRLTHPGAGQTFYFLLTDRFANGSTTNDTGGLAGGPDVTGFDPTRISHYHGGDFVGLTAKLDYLKNLGVTAVWVTPPFKNKPMQQGTAGYHGYWITDFLAIDPHLGTNEEYRTFIREAHARGLKVFMDIIVNHTADVIQLSGDYRYRPIATAPYRTAAGEPFDVRAAAANGLAQAMPFPALSLEKSFPYVPTVPAAEAHVKNPAWLNDPRYYHNRGNTTFTGENSTHGDFVGLDDLFTEHPRVVEGMIEIFNHWLTDYGVDGFRIDTARHVNSEFWQAFSPAIRARARELGRPDFLQFGEVYNEAGDPAVLSEFSTGTIPIDTTIDFGFFAAARRFVSQAGPAAALADFFERDDYYTDHDGNVHATTTFLGNHDAGRFAYFLRQDNPDASPALLADLAKLGHGLLLLSRGQPVLYYGDEQGLIGRGGNDMQARESLFAAQAPDFKNAPLLATTRTGADDKFDEQHPFYQLIRQLGALRAAHPALRTGAMLPRATGVNGLFAFSRLERGEQIEYLAAFNASRTASLTATLPTSQPAGAKLTPLFTSAPTASTAPLVTDAQGRATLSLAPLQFALWRATNPLPTSPAPLAVAMVPPSDGSEWRFTAREVDGLIFPSRQEIRAHVTGADDFAEVTFTLTRASRPGQCEWLGTDDTAPYRIFWSPPADLAPGETLTFTATVSDLRGRRATASLSPVTITAPGVAFGIRGATVPVLTARPPATLTLNAGESATLTVAATGTGPLEYQWLRNDTEIAGATQPTLTLPRASAALAGKYRVLVRNRAGTVVSPETLVAVNPATAGRIVSLPRVTSQFVPARRVDVWLPPGYDTETAARYPVVYLHDGQNLFDPLTGFGGACWEIDQAALRQINTRKMSGVILVGIWNTGLGRYAEYMPRKAVTGDTVSFFSDRGPTMPATAIRSDAYLRFLVTELKSLIDRTYRTRPEAAHTFIMGSSMGGLISAYAAAEYPEVFGGAACVSTHWPAGNGAMIDYLATHLPAPGVTRFYFDHGTATLDAHYGPFQQRADAVMRQAGYAAGRDWLTREFAGADHSEKSWRLRAEIPLQFLLGND